MKEKKPQLPIEKKYKISNKIVQIPQTREEMAQAFLQEENRIQREYEAIEVENEILNNKQQKLLGKIAEERLGLLAREKNNIKREKENLEYGKSINKIYPNTITFYNGEENFEV